ncbi:isoleucine--tRNA ligase [Estrella lausannensis]|uniref:Isoleucine--tRNA ligase n=1 Tax=Estrella lausannensis TaxID=483423 RepID=A0A0H5DR76_9BACT|nr:isoleucine--tRNA ligase [Estrella lausannensis]CRX39186.1 Isoleucyl-tRNA synthetase [Estrella lausannensis]
MLDEVVHDSFDEREKKVLEFWKKNRIFERSVEQNKDKPPFTFYDGPPFATGLPHYGHLLAGTIKDVVPRYKTMKGYHVPRRFGWDCHGLPIENEIEKNFNLSGSASIEEFGIAEFNEECRKIVLRYTEEWKSVVSRMGRFVDFENTYKTMDLTFMESVLSVFKSLYEKGLVYEGYKVMPFSAKLGTPLSNFEAGENYKDVDDPSITIAFPLEKEPGTSLLIWTTTPWTLISNLAVMAGPEIDYVKIEVKGSGERYILAKSRLGEYFKEEESYTILSTMKGKELAGLTYEPLFNYFLGKKEEGAFRVILEPSVSTEDGTGLVHSAPAFGEADFFACQREKIPLVCPVDINGKFTQEIPEHAGLFVKDADKAIIRRVKESGRLFRQATIHHRYPFCWRSDTPLIYKVVETWFVAVEKIKDKLLEANRQIHWMPEHIKEGRFGKWLEGARDWAISRNRYFGTPIPIWRAEDGEIHVIGSIKELEELTETKVTDLHRHFIDHLTFEKGGKVFRRIPEVFDCWFESGSMPYAQNHYPFENKENFERTFPADFIAEGLDQTRGWFYTLTILAAALYDKPAFKNVIVNGIILAEDGAKMSKRLRNYPDPMEVVKRYGADAVRLYMLHSPAVRAEDLCFKESGVELVLRQILIPLWNAYSFFVTYARISGWRPEKHLEEGDFPREEVLDRWILSRLNHLIKDVEEGMDRYDLSSAVEPFVGFVDDLTNWYIRRSRRRFWSDEKSAGRDQAFATLYYVLLELSKIAAPFVPFISEAIYGNLKGDHSPESVHLAAFPAYKENMRDLHLEESMEMVKRAVSLGHALRKEKKLKVRQPLPLATLISAEEKALSFLEEHKFLIEDELNVKGIHFARDEREFVTISTKPNFKTLGRRLGKKMKAGQEVIEKLTNQELSTLLEGKSLQLTLEGEPFELLPEDIEIRRTVKEGVVAEHSAGLTIALETTLTDELIREGLAREIVNKINTMRRDLGFHVTDRIHVTVETTEKVKESYLGHAEWINGEVLALTFEFKKSEGTSWDLNGEMATIAIRKG